jgi:uncharacterized protein YggL (DUF469 family)
MKLEINAEVDHTGDPFWVSVTIDNASMHGYVDGERLGKIAKHLTEAHNKWLAARESLEEFNSRRFHPTVHDRIAEHGK